ncbi:MAG: hypothetical protein KKF78_06770 [Candidatus Omnitrophica bacterium]|nr:hypothetical protein [Candidatus Omnitrophota bacterium]MBU1996841.1 hypothetical protein [Candidatus Omnitrophota bacterium]
MNKEKKDIVIPLRISRSQHVFLEEFAKKKMGMTLSAYIREASIDLAVRTLEDDEFMSNDQPENKVKAKNTFHKYLEDFEGNMITTWGNIDERLLKLEKFMETFAYCYLYHTKEVQKEDRERADVSANERLDIVMKMVLESLQDV